MEAASCAGKYERCGRVTQKSNWLGRWHDRYMTLGDGVVRFFSEDEASSFVALANSCIPTTPGRCSALDTTRSSPQNGSLRSRSLDAEECDPIQLGYSVLRRETMSLPVARIEYVWAASEARFRRPNCFIILVRKKSKRGWQLGIQAPDPESQRLWVHSLTVARTALMMAPQFAPSKVPACELESDSSVVVRPVVVPKLNLPLPGCPLLQLPAAGGKGKGRALPPPLPKAKAKMAPKGGKAMGKQSSLFGKRLHVQPIDQAINLDNTVFSGMLTSSRGNSRGSSCRGSSAAGSSHGSDTNIERSDVSDESSDSSEDSDVVEHLRETFRAKELSDETIRKRQMLEKRRQEKKKTIFDSRIAQNLDIVLRSLSISVETLATALEKMDFSTSISVDELERIRVSMPPSDQLTRLLSFEGELGELRSVEQDVMKLMRVNRFDARLRIIALEKGIRVRLRRLIDDATCVRVACQQMSNSPLLRDILEAILRMFNFVNHGVVKLDQGTVRAFDITTAFEVAEFKASDCFLHNSLRLGQPVSKVNFTGLHFAVSRVLIRKPTATSMSFAAELKSVHEAAGLSLRSIAGDVAQLLQEAQFLEKEIASHHERYETQGNGERQENTSKLSRAPDQNETLAVVPKSKTPVRIDDHVVKASGLSPVREDIGSRPGLLTDPDIIVVGTPRRFTKVFKERMASAARRLGVGPKVPVGASWLQEIRGSYGCLGGLRRKWRRVAIKHHMLEVHRSVGAMVVAMPDARITPFSSQEASPDSQALYSQCPYGFEIATAQKPSKLFRFECPSGGILEHWLRVLRAEACVAGCGWLDIATPRTNEASDLRRMKWSRRWVTLKRAGELHLYKSPRSARKHPNRPLTVLQTVGRQFVGFFNRSGIPDEVEAHGRKWLFNVVDSNWNYHYCSAPSANAFERWCRSVQQHSPGLSTTRPLEELVGQFVQPECSDTSWPVSVPVAMVQAVVETEVVQEQQVPQEPNSSSLINMAKSFDIQDVESQPADASQRRKVVLVPRLDFGKLRAELTPNKVVVRAKSTRSDFGPSDSETSAGEGDEMHNTVSPPSTLSPQSVLEAGVPEVPVLSPIETALQRMEKVKEDALAGEKATRKAINDACQQALQTMRYFGQATPFVLDADGQPEDIGKFADSIKKFLLAVDNFLQRVGSAWREIEVEREARCREGLEDLPMRTPREWSKSIVETPRSARGLPTPRSARGVQTPRNARSTLNERLRRRGSADANTVPSNSKTSTAFLTWMDSTESEMSEVSARKGRCSEGIIHERFPM